ncbi:uncharacterized protein [Nicotiana sylvestris]|uniref:uncharacterized protein n=1 Tax=Nicotiana sylvestris TaxID=4096 RepID=UPI00388CC0BB
MVNFDVILGMDWLSLCRAIVDCHTKIVMLAMWGVPRIEWRGSTNFVPSRMISFLKAQRMVGKGCLSYLAFVRDVSAETPSIDSVPVVRYFPDVFPADLLGMPLDRNIDFGINLVLRTQPNSVPPYRMAPAKLKELKEQLQELLEKGLKPHEKNYLVHDLELVVIVHALKIWRHYLYGKVNVVTDAFSRKAVSMGSLAYIPIRERPLAVDVQALANREHQYDDPHLFVFKDKVQHYDARDVTIGDQGVLRMQGQICVSNVDGLRLLGIDLVQDALDKVRVIEERLRTAQSRQKSYADRKRIREETYELALPPSLSSVHQVFHVSMLWKYIGDPSHVLYFSTAQLDGDMTYDVELVAILERLVRKLRSKDIASVKVQWRGRPVEEATWETEQKMRADILTYLRLQVSSLGSKVSLTPLICEMKEYNMID